MFSPQIYTHNKIERMGPLLPSNLPLALLMNLISTHRGCILGLGEFLQLNLNEPSSFARWSPPRHMLLLCCKRSAIEEINILDNRAAAALNAAASCRLLPSAVFDSYRFFFWVSVGSCARRFSNLGELWHGTFLFHLSQAKTLFYDWCEMVMHTYSEHTHTNTYAAKSTQAFLM